ncbi:MAG: ATP-grasp domain-containing protein [Deltaproteobacteria bacterium]|nr:ATP-grasp domain-containing protein [Deltaproteobacteria bacterium]
MTRVLVAYSPTRMSRDEAGRPRLEQHILSTVNDVVEALRKAGYRVESAALSRDPRRFLAAARRFRPKAVFNLCEGVAGEAELEMHAVALFELARLRHTGNGCLALAVCLEKATTKRLLRTARIDTPDFLTVAPGEEPEGHPGLPAIVKPALSDGSLGITSRSVVKTQAALRQRVQYVHRWFRQPALVERYVVGREFQVAMVGNLQPDVLAVAELSYRGLPRALPRICSYSAKWDPSSHYYRHTNPVLPAAIPDALRQRLVTAALRAWRVLGMRGYGRVDFRVRRNRPFVVDVNPNCDISADAGLARAARYAGMTYAQLCDRVVRLALE